MNREMSADDIPYRIAETVGAAEAESRGSMPQSSSHQRQLVAEKSPGLFGVYRRIFTVRPDWRLDAALVAFIAVAGFAIGVEQIQRTENRNAIREAVIYQATHAPAVMIACGKGFHNVARGEIPSLDRFLNLKTASFSCDEIPADANLKAPDRWQRYYLYLMYAFGLVWKLRFISRF